MKMRANWSVKVAMGIFTERKPPLEPTVRDDLCGVTLPVLVG
jgi:hypothetical protein